MYLFSMQKEDIRRQLWNKEISQKKPNMIKCDNCGDPSFNVCNCKYMAFVPTPAQISAFQMNKLLQPEKQIDYKKVKDLMWDKKSLTIVGITVICSVCGGGSPSNCECRRKEFNPSKEEMDKFIRDNPGLCKNSCYV
jgi:hypothetical protein